MKSRDVPRQPKFLARWPIFVSLVSLGISIPAAAVSVPIAGRAEIIDGDTIAVEGTIERIRLYGIDAPEGKQTCEDGQGRQYLCGSRSAEALSTIVGRNGRVSCVAADSDRYGRIVATCSVGGLDINAEMVRRGWALEFPKYSDGRYGLDQEKAKAAKRGLWQGPFVSPRKWRKGERAAAKAMATPQVVGCDIKGNISANGRIYRVPGQERYPLTTVNETKGERWFCTESEAMAAGWRRAK